MAARVIVDAWLQQFTIYHYMKNRGLPVFLYQNLWHCFLSKSVSSSNFFRLSGMSCKVLDKAGRPVLHCFNLLLLQIHLLADTNYQYIPESWQTEEQHNLIHAKTFFAQLFLRAWNFSALLRQDHWSDLHGLESGHRAVSFVTTSLQGWWPLSEPCDRNQIYVLAIIYIIRLQIMYMC